MKAQAYQILYSAWETLKTPTLVKSHTDSLVDIAADLIATALELDPCEDAAPAAEPVSREALRNAVPVAPRPTSTEEKQEFRGALIQKFQVMIDANLADNLKDALSVIHNSGFSYAVVARLLGCTSAGIGNAAKNGGRDIEKRFWKIFSKPNTAPKKEEA